MKSFISRSDVSNYANLNLSGTFCALPLIGPSGFLGAFGDGFKAPRAALHRAFKVPAGKLLERRDLRNRYGVFADREDAGDALAEFMVKEITKALGEDV